MCISQSIVRICFALTFVFFLTASALAGIPEPGILLYGQVRDESGSLITSGELVWMFTPEASGDPVTVSTQLSEIEAPGGPFCYHVLIPLEWEVPGYPVSENRLPVSDTPVPYTRTAQVTGTDISITDSVNLSVADRGTSVNIPIGISSTDMDADRLPDTWEQQIIDADPNDASETIDDVRPGDDFDGDGASNLQEYLAGTDPTDPLDYPPPPLFDEDFETGDLRRFPWVTTGAGVWSVTTTTNHTPGGVYAAEAPAIADNESASLAIRMYCDEGNIRFWYQVSSEQDFDFLSFSIDDIEQGAWSGDVPLTQATVAVTAGMHTFQWVYAKDKSGASDADTAWVDDISLPVGMDSDFDGIPDGWETENGLDPLFDDADADADGDGFSNYREYVADTDPRDENDFPSVEPKVEDFETGDLSRLPWVTTGPEVWSVTTTTNHTPDGMYAAEAPALGDNESASLAIRTYCEDGHIRFWYQVSSEQDFDLLSFYIDDIEHGAWSGEVPLTQATVAVTAGMHTFQWVYAKDKSGVSGADTAWVDDISLPVGIDSDFDGMPDGWEIENGLNPWFNDAQDDADGGGLSNIKEYEAGLDPLDSSDDAITDTTIELTLPSGWSMISLPVDPIDKKLTTLFPDAVVVYGYDKETGYIRVEENEDLAVGRSYWILLDQGKTYTFTGQPIQSYTRAVPEQGWYMIGGGTSPAQATVANGHIVVIYSYVQGSGYQRVLASEHLEPGKGYWILISDTAAQAELLVETITQGG